MGTKVMTAATQTNTLVNFVLCTVLLLVSVYFTAVYKVHSAVHSVQCIAHASGLHSIALFTVHNPTLNCVDSTPSGLLATQLLDTGEPTL